MSDAERPAWLVPVALVMVLAIFAPCAYNAFAWIGRPFPGFLVLENGIVVSMGRSHWIRPERRRTQWTRLLAVAGQPVAGGRDLQEYLESATVGKPIPYTFRQGTEIFRLALNVRPFRTQDFLEVFAPMLAVGLLMVLAGAVVVMRRPNAPQTQSLFIVCLILGLEMITGPDVYHPYWFTRINYLTICLVPPALVHLALTYPQHSRLLRRPAFFSAGLYLPFFGLWIGVLTWMSEPAIFLPLLYILYFLTANAALFYAGRLVLALIEGVQPVRPIVLALAGSVGSSLLVLTILVSYPLLQRPISPALALAPLLLFPMLTGIAFVRFPAPTVPAQSAVRKAA